MNDIIVKFTKMGAMQYISHLDLQRALGRMLLRSELPIAYSEGFNPHPKLNILLPLSVYQEGENEMFEFRLTEFVDIETVKAALEKSVFQGMDILDVFYTERKLTPKKAVWRLELETSLSASQLSECFGGEMAVTKRTKKGEKLVDISPMVEFISAEDSANGVNARFCVNAATNDYLNPSYIAVFLGDKVKLIRTVRENIIF